jgi:dienelactone hydrolase
MSRMASPLRLAALFAAMAMIAVSPAQAETVQVLGANGQMLTAELIRPQGPPKAPAIVALHGCAGPLRRDLDWARHLAALGHIVLLPDSYAARGLGPQCRNRHRTVTSTGLRRADAIASARWLAAQKDTPPGGIALLGWSDGGNTVLWTAQERPDLPRGLFRSFVAFYPGCKTASRMAGWRPAAPMMILVGAADDWTPAPPCRDLAARFPRLITLIVYPGAYHDFDAPGEPVRELSGLATPPSGTGQAHHGTNPAARQDALRRVPAFLAGAGAE